MELIGHMEKAGIYVRVSEAGQHAESQVYDLWEIAAKQGFEVVGEYWTRPDEY